MKNVKKILMALAMLTTLNASAIYRLAPEDVEYFIQYYSSYFPYVNNQPTRYAIYSEVTSGDYDSDQGAFLHRLLARHYLHLHGEIGMTELFLVLPTV